MHRALLALALLLLASALAAPLAAQGPTPDTSLGPGTGGQTAWDCRNPQPYGWVRSDLPLPLLRAKAAHEEAHVRQMQSWGSCEAWQAALRDLPGLPYDMEAQAYCAEARESVAAGLAPDLGRAIYDAALLLVQPIYPWRVGWWQAVASIRRACGLSAL